MTLTRSSSLLLSAAILMTSFFSSAAFAENTTTRDAVTPFTIEAHYNTLKQARAKNLQQLIAYRNAGVFPDNSHLDRPLAVFRDPRNVYCAFANLMVQDGHAAVVNQIARTNNHLLVSDVQGGAVLDWILHSGFTQEEAARIQVPGFMYREPDPALLKPHITPEVAKRQDIQRQLDKVIDSLQRESHMSLTRAVAAKVSKTYDLKKPLSPWKVTYLLKQAQSRADVVHAEPTNDWARRLVSKHMRAL